MMSKRKTQSIASLLPKRLKKQPIEKDRTTRREWETFIFTLLKKYKKVENKNPGKSYLYIFDLTGPMERRRAKATLNLMEEVYERYSPYADAPYNTLGEQWVNINYDFNTYSKIEGFNQILTAASLWILDRISETDEKWTEMLKLLPKDRSLLDEVNLPNMWVPITTMT